MTKKRKPEDTIELAHKRSRNDVNKPQNKWQDGTLDITIQNITPNVLKKEVTKQRAKHPGLTNVQLLHDHVAQGSKCQSLAKKFLTQHAVTLWGALAAATNRPRQEPFHPDGSLAVDPKHLPGMITHVLGPTSHTRPLIVLQDLSQSLQTQVNSYNAGTKRSCEQAVHELAITKYRSPEAIGFLCSFISRNHPARMAYIEWFNKQYNSAKTAPVASQHPSLVAHREHNQSLAAELKGYTGDWSDGADTNSGRNYSDSDSIVSGSSAPSVGVATRSASRNMQRSSRTSLDVAIGKLSPLPPIDVVQYSAPMAPHVPTGPRSMTRTVNNGHLTAARTDTAPPPVGQPILNGHSSTALAVSNGGQSPAPSVGDVANPPTYSRRDYVGEVDTSRLPAPVYMNGLSATDRQKQTEKWGATRFESVVRCQRCGCQGHMEISCANIHSNPPEKCHRCRQRGHHEKTCRSPPVVAGAFGDECDLCGKLGHAEAECSYIWFHPGFNQYELKSTVRRSEILQSASCYNCGGRGHYGDDCPTLPDHVKARSGQINAWSEKTLQKTYRVLEDVPGYGQKNTRRALSEDGELSDARPSVPAYQMAQLNDFR